MSTGRAQLARAHTRLETYEASLSKAARAAEAEARALREALATEAAAAAAQLRLAYTNGARGSCAASTRVACRGAVVLQ